MLFVEDLCLDRWGAWVRAWVGCGCGRVCEITTRNATAIPAIAPALVELS